MATIVPSAAFSIIVYSESSIGFAVSITLVALISLLSLVNSSISFFVSFATLTVLASCAFVTCTLTASLPFVLEIDCRSSPTEIFAMSLSLTEGMLFSPS